MEEIWKDIAGYEGRYMVSNFGRVKSMRCLAHDGEKIMKTVRHHTGYMIVSLGRKPRKVFLVHVLVANAFIENKEKKPYVNHIDGNKANNKASNLEWVTAKENTSHAIKTGLRDSNKPVYQYDLRGNLVKKWDSQSAAARFYNKRPGNINNCVRGRNKTYLGYIWRDENE